MSVARDIEISKIRPGYLLHYANRKYYLLISILNDITIQSIAQYVTPLDAVAKLPIHGCNI